MDIKVGQLITSLSVLNQLFNEKVDGKLALKLYKFIKSLKTEIDAYESVRLKLLKEYGVENKAAQKYDFKNKKAEAQFAEQMQEVLDSTVTLELVPLNEDDLVNLPSITPAEIELISWAISDN